MNELVAVPKPRVHQKDQGFLRYLRQLRCWVCEQHHISNRCLVEAAHIESRKFGDVENAIPLCTYHHQHGKYSFHRLGGRHRFAEYWKVDLVDLAHWYYWSYLEWKAEAAW